MDEGVATDELVERHAADPCGPLLRGWLLSTKALIKERKTPLVDPATLFSVGFLVNGGCTSSSWSWTASAFTDRLATVAYWDDDMGLPFNGEVHEPHGHSGRTARGGTER